MARTKAPITATRHRGEASLRTDLPGDGMSFQGGEGGGAFTFEMQPPNNGSH